MWEIILAISCVLLAWIFYSQSKSKNYPPGPLTVPLFGNLLQLGVRPWETLAKWKAKYGPILAFEMGGLKIIFIQDVKIMKETFADPNFADRGYFPGAVEVRENGNRGIVFSNGPNWVEQRRFTLKNLRDLGFGRKSMESLVQDEIKDLLETIRKDLGKPISTKNIFNAAVVNSLWSIMYGERFKQNDKQLAEIIAQLTESVTQKTLQQVLMMNPFLNKYVPSLTGLSKMLKDLQKTVDFIKGKVADHNKNYIEGQPRDFIDIFMDEIKKAKNPNSSFYEKEGDLQMLFVLFDMFVAGSETTSNGISWLLLFLSRYPEVQKKVQNEIKSVIGNSRLPSLEDKPNLVFTEATICEMLRHANISPLGGSRAPIKDLENFHGYKIPKGTSFLSNSWLFHMDKDIWGDPENFRPERFIENGKIVRKDELFAFGYGKRVCPGETLAKDELFLFVASIYQNFNVNHDPNKIPSLEGVMGAGLVYPKDHQLIFTEIN